ncbi:MAG: hydroxymethylbilane synthase [Eubacterium sp.]|nr:hydroxymethylbilane synthase [Eubacterium sp.]
MKKVIRIGTRKSLLALIQTDLVKEKISEAFPDLSIEIAKIDTKGDQMLDRSLTSFGGKGVFTQELEAELLSGKVDIAVHSAKDMPMEFPEGLGIGAVLSRADVRDVFVTTSGKKLADLEPGSVVGTSSLRRELQVREINPDVEIRMLRGNVQTRLRKLREGLYDGILLAAAGIERLSCQQEEGIFYEYLDPEVFLPAAGQGILAVESRTEDSEIKEILDRIHCEDAACLLEAERAFLTAIGGSCNAPAAAVCRQTGNTFSMRAMFSRDGRRCRREYMDITFEEKNKLKAARKLGKDIAGRLREGKVWLVGAGPGDEDLFTRKGLAVIRQADVVVYDSLATDSILNEIRDDAELIYAGKRSSHHHLKQYETNRLLIDLAREGKQVVRLKGGDPYIFGRGGEEGQELEQAGVAFEVVPGISSSYAVPSYCGIPVTHRDYASSFHVITGHEGDHKKGENVLDYSTLAKEEGTLIFLMGLKNLPNIVENLIANGKDPATPAGVLQEGTTARQKVATGSLADIVEVVEREGIRTPAITVVGDVVGLHDTLNWYGKKPLFGQRVLVTGTRSMVDRLSPLLKEEGAEAISFSLIRTEPMEDPQLAGALADIKSYSWIVFTSANGVNCFFDRIRRDRMDIRSFAHIHFAVIGSGTRDALESHGIYSDFVPTAYSSEDMATAILPHLGKDDRVLLLRAKEANQVLPDTLAGAGIDCTCISLYHTVRDYRKQEELNRLIPSVDYVTFASSSAVKAFADMIEDPALVKGRIISIGPVTSKTIRAAGYHVDREAREYTARGITEAIRTCVETDCKEERDKT